MKFDNLLQLFEDRAEKNRNQKAIRFKKENKWNSISWDEWRNKSRNIARTLLSFNSETNENIALFARTSPEWIIAETGIRLTGATPVPIHSGISQNELHFILFQAEIKTIFVENPYSIKKILALSKRGDVQVNRIVYFHDTCFIESGQYSGEIYTINDLFKQDIPDNVLSFDEFSAFGEELHEQFDDLINSRINSITPHSPALLIYTSGTTGMPKGVILTNANLLFEISRLNKIIPISAGDNHLIFIPLSHILGYVVYQTTVLAGGNLTLLSGTSHLLENIKDANPHLILTVPLFCEKIMERIENNVKENTLYEKFLFDWARDIRSSYLKQIKIKKKPSALLNAKFKIADRLILQKTRNMFGENLKYLISGGAHLPARVGKYLYSLGILVVEGYGLTETCSAVTVNPPNAPKFGTVGLPFEGVELQLSDAGEILVRGGNLFTEYYKNKEETDAAFTADGWFKTGDIGELDEDGYLIIKGKIKELIVTTDGQNIPPVKIETLIKSSDFINDALVYGDSRPYITALVKLSEKPVIEYAKSHKIKFTDFTDLIRDPEIYNLVEQEIFKINSTLARIQRVKKFAVVAHDFHEETNNTLGKLQRQMLYKKYRALFESFYNDNT